MKVEITVDDKVETIDLSVNSLTLQDAVAVQKEIGDEKWDRLAEGSMRPDVLRAVLWAKLRHRFPDSTIDDFDFDLAAMSNVESDPTSGAN